MPNEELIEEKEEVYMQDYYGFKNNKKPHMTKEELIEIEKKEAVFKKSFWGRLGEFIKKTAFVYYAFFAVTSIYSISLIWASSDSKTLFAVTVSEVAFVILFIGFWMSVIQYNTRLVKEKDAPLGTVLMVLAVLAILDINGVFVGYVFLGLATLNIIMFISLFNEGPGSVSGMMLIPVFILVPLGLALIGSSFF